MISNWNLAISSAVEGLEKRSSQFRWMLAKKAIVMKYPIIFPNLVAKLNKPTLYAISSQNGATKHITKNTKVGLVLTISLIVDWFEPVPSGSFIPNPLNIEVTMIELRMLPT